MDTMETVIDKILKTHKEYNTLDGIPYERFFENADTIRELFNYEGKNSPKQIEAANIAAYKLNLVGKDEEIGVSAVDEILFIGAISRPSLLGNSDFMHNILWAKQSFMSADELADSYIEYIKFFGNSKLEYFGSLLRIDDTGNVVLVMSEQ